MSTLEETWTVVSDADELRALVGTPVKRVAGLDVPLPYAANLERMALPQSGNIVEAARAGCHR